MAVRKSKARRSRPPRRPRSRARAGVSTRPGGSNGAPLRPRANRTRRPPLTVVAVGASAGGVEAAQDLFARLPAQTGIAFVFIIHLDPTRESLVDQVIATHTTHPVLQAEDGMRLEPDRIHVAPPGRSLLVSDGVLRVGPPGSSRGDRLPIDQFLTSLAVDQGAHAGCVILSGAGSDGAHGLREIVAAGGVAIVQEPATARFSGMPQSAVASGVADYVLPIADIPAVLLHRAGVRPNGRPAGRDQEEAARLTTLLSLLHSRLGLNFEAYKTRTLVRRIHRRMGLLRVTSIGEYIARLREDADEVRALSHDFLIGVTDFFREPEAWAALEQTVLQGLVQRADPGQPIRVWVAGCATGQEGYSVAMLLLEHIEASGRPIGLNVFASDVSEEALATAREGAYPKGIETRLSAARLRRFFARGGDSDHWRVNKELRDVVVFAAQNLLTDPPYSRMDLICCRNLLIYLEPAIQQRVLSMFHFALRPEGSLFLGPAESVGDAEDRFRPLSKKWRIFQRLGASRPARIELPLLPRTDHHRGPDALGSRDVRSREPRLAALAQHIVLERFAPAAVLVNGRNETLYFSGATERYLRQPRGAPTNDLLMLVREGLSARLREALTAVAARDTTVELRDLRVKRGDAFQPVRITVLPVAAPDLESAPLRLVVFQDDPRPAGAQPRRPQAPESEIIRQLEDDLIVARGDLKASLEQLGTSNEKFRSANEEVMSINEELQSTNEELETSREELQSVNEELSTVNSQLQAKVVELESANNDLSNLLASTDIATLCLDRQHRIKWFTPATTNLLNLLPADQGRSIGDFATRFEGGNLLHDVGTVLRKLAPLEHRIQADNGRWYIQRILPYRTEEDRIDGVVVTFTDITSALRAETELEGLNESLERRVESRTHHLRLIQQAAVIANEARTLENALAQVLELLCRHGGWQLGHAWLADPDMPETFVDSGVWWQDPSGGDRSFVPRGWEAQMRPCPDQLGRVIATGQARAFPDLTREGSSVWAEAAVAAGLRSAFVLPVPVGHRIGALLELFSDQPLEIDESLRELMILIGVELGRAVERERFSRRLAELADEERREIGQELHDGIGQQLAGLGLLTASLRQSLEGQPHAAKVADIARTIDETLEQVRALTKGVLPVPVEADGLADALEELAAQFSGLPGVECRFTGERPVTLHDNTIASHLFRVAQEAVRNAVEHGHARHVSIGLADGDQVILSVRDDGVGMKMIERSSGNGLRIMQYRADLMGGTLDIASVEGEGVTVTCVVPRREVRSQEPRVAAARTDSTPGET